MTTRLLLTIPRVGPAFQLSLTRPALTSRVMSPSSESTAMSASNPEAIARLWAPEALYDSSNRTVRPVRRFHSAANAGSRPSWKASRTTE